MILFAYRVSTLPPSSCEGHVSKLREHFLGIISEHVSVFRVQEREFRIQERGNAVSAADGIFR
jgi:hypothetical protein